MDNFTPTPNPLFTKLLPDTLDIEKLNEAFTALDIDSVFDIVRHSRTAFIRRFAKHHDGDGAAVYDSAMGYAIQIGRSLREHQVSNSLLPIEPSGVSNAGPTYPELFKENWSEFCNAGALEAMNSPVAYLASLRRFAQSDIEESSESADRIPLALRRPDIDELLLDEQNTYGQVPMLDIVRQVLKSGIERYLASLDPAPSLARALTTQRYPIVFPYDLAHRQAQLALQPSPVKLGEINFAITPMLPLSSSVRYGHSGEHSLALLSGLAASQQALLTAPLLPSTHTEPLSEEHAAFFQAHYGVDFDSHDMAKLTGFCARTGLAAADVEALLAQNAHQAQRSPNDVLREDQYAAPGALFVNGPMQDGASPLGLRVERKERARVVYITYLDSHRLDRMQRMVRLQSWLGMPFHELDALLMAALQAAGNTELAPDASTLRALGAFRYFNRHYKVAAAEFAAWLHQLGVHGSHPRRPLFDQVFNSPVLFEQALQIDGKPFSLDSDQDATVFQISSGLKVDTGVQGMELLAKATKTHLGSLERTLPVFSSFYRQARVAALFGLDIAQCQYLITLLGGQDFQRILVKGGVRPIDAEPSDDFIDVLLRLDCAVRWLKQHGLSINDLRNLLEPSQMPLSPALRDQYERAAVELRHSCVDAMQLQRIKQTAGTQPSGNWLDALTGAGLLSASGLTHGSAIAQGEAERKQFTAQVTTLLEDADTASIAAIVQLLIDSLERQRGLVRALLQDSAQIPESFAEPVARFAGTSIRSVAEALLSTQAETASLRKQAMASLHQSIGRISRYGAACRWLHIGTRALTELLAHPQWLSHENDALTLDFATLAKLKAYTGMVDSLGLTEDQWLGYLRQANRKRAIENPPNPSHGEALRGQLAQLLGSSSAELQVLLTELPAYTATCVAHLDWLHRCLLTSKVTGLGARALLKACTLNSKSSETDWQYVGQAAISSVQVDETALKESERDALVAYYLSEVIPNEPTFKTLGLAGHICGPDDLYAFMLLDTQVSHAVTTTPVESAIASLQQYINAAALGMEPGYPDAPLSAAALKHWRDERSQYDLWAASQQQSWYPSLYLEPALRRNKSSYFQQLENDINQSRIDHGTTEAAVKAYLANFEEVANLSVINGYIDSDDFAQGTYYFIGKSCAENVYYWRSVNMADRNGPAGAQVDNPSPAAWSDWHKANLPISGAALEQTIRPVYFNNRLFVVWVETVPDVAPFQADPDWPPKGEEKPAAPAIRRHQDTRKLRLLMTYKKYDDTWSAPQTYLETTLDPTQLVDGSLPELQTIAVADVSTNPESLYLAIYAGYAHATRDDDDTPDSVETSADGAQDTYAVLRTVFVDKNFNVMPLFPKRGAVAADEPTIAHDKAAFVRRAGALMARANAGRFQFPIRLKVTFNELLADSPFADVEGPTNWNYNGWQDLIANITEEQGADFDEQRCEITLTSRLTTTIDLVKQADGADLVCFHSWWRQDFMYESPAHTMKLMEIIEPPPPEKTKLEPDVDIARLTLPIDPELMRPDWPQAFESPQDKEFFLFHGVEIGRRNADGATQLVGSAIKAVNIELTLTYASGAHLVAPKLGRYLNPTLGTAEFIDFSESSIAQSDADNSRPRAPIRMNTLFARTLIDRANQGLETLLSWNTQNLREPSLSDSAEQPVMDFNGANGVYFWELFVHLPMLIAQRMNSERNYDACDYWLAFIFDPGRRNSGGNSHDYWNVRPLIAPSRRERATRTPGDPHSVASDNPVHYRKAVYHQYLKNLMDRGDAAYRRLTHGALGEAKLCYARVAKLLGPRPDRYLISDWTPIRLGQLVASESPAARALEQRLLAGDPQQGHGLIHTRFELDHTLAELDNAHHRVALNPELLTYWDTVQRRLDNLRHHRTLDGKPLHLSPLATATGPGGRTAISTPSAGPGGYGQLAERGIPHYRFTVMHSRASAAVDTLIQFGGTLLSLLERQEQAQFLELQQQQAWTLANASLSLQQQTHNAQLQSRQALLTSRAMIQARLEHYSELSEEGVSRAEIAAGSLHLAGRIAEQAAFISQAAGEALKVVPNHAGGVGGALIGFSNGIVAGSHVGGWRLEGVPGIATAFSHALASSLHSRADALDRTEQYRRRQQEWEHARQQASLELEHMDAQLAWHDQQTRASEEQLRHTRLMLEQAHTTYRFLSQRFSNAQLYQWLNNQFATFYTQVYDTTLSLCLAAEACWQYEIADFDTRFIQPGAWHDSYRGLSAGEGLKLNLLKMESAYLQRNDRHLEIVKTISLRQMLEAQEQDWTATITALDANHGLTIDLPQTLFDNDYPGHYLRRIKRVSVTLPMLLAPYEDVQAVLTQTFSRVEMNPAVGASVRDNLRASQQVALSTGMDDDGLFTLHFDDERYLPFEGTGAVSRWDLRFTRPTPEMLASLSDVILRISYTARSA